MVTNVQDRQDYDLSGALVTLDEGETLKDVNFNLVRGGVITGRVTDAAGRPVIGQLVLVAAAEKAVDEQAEMAAANSNHYTDDRGVFRYYGLLPGKYVVSCGRAPNSSGMQEISYGFKNTFYDRTFYPAATTKEEAEIIEVAAGSETANIDIRLGKLQHGFRVAGRAVNDQTGAAITKVFVRAERMGEGDKGELAGYSPADENGEFVLQGLVAGTYKLCPRRQRQRALLSRNQGRSHRYGCRRRGSAREIRAYRKRHDRDR